MPPNTAFHCQYAMQFIAVMRGYGLPVDAPSTAVLREAGESCPKLRAEPVLESSTFSNPTLSW